MQVTETILFFVDGTGCLRSSCTGSDKVSHVLIVQACEFMFTGDGFYRHHEPSRFLSRLPGVTVIDVHATHRFLWPLITAADVLILPVLTGWELFPLIEQRRRDGKITVLETNDYFHEMQPWNPIAQYWLDPDMQSEHIEHIRRCDAVQTSTQRLADHWRPYAREVAVFPNHLSTVPELLPAPDRPLTIGWAGSQGHLADWFATSEILQGWLNAHPEVHLAVMTHQSAHEYIRLPKERYYFQEAGILAEYMEFLPRLDIGLAPLLPIEYNHCRSDVKFLEYAIRGVAGIYSNLGPYNDSVRHDENGLLYGSPEELIACLDSLVSNPAQRARIRANAYTEVAATRRMEQHVSRRYDFYRSLMKREPWAGELPPEVPQAAEIDGRYYRLISGETEKPVTDVLNGTVNGDPDNNVRLQELLSRYPLYITCGRTLTRRLNDAGKSQHALAVGKHLLTVTPESAQTLSEIGRSYFLLGQHGPARDFLKQAVEVNPTYVPSWIYLLRYLANSSPQELATYISIMRGHLPDSYRLAMLALRLSPKKGSVMSLAYLLKDFDGKMSARQLEAAAAEFVATIDHVLAEQLDDPASPELLAHARQMFPYSARVATLYGRALLAQGRHAAATEQLNHANNLFRAATQFSTEYSRQDYSPYLWQIAGARTAFTPGGHALLPAQTGSGSSSASCNTSRKCVTTGKRA